MHTTTYDCGKSIPATRYTDMSKHYYPERGDKVYHHGRQPQPNGEVFRIKWDEGMVVVKFYANEPNGRVDYDDFSMDLFMGRYDRDRFGGIYWLPEE